MKCSFCNTRLYIQEIIKETRIGVASIFHVKCVECLKITQVKTGEQYMSPATGKPLFILNTKTALGNL